jgi:hypothetical protein
MIPTSIFLQTQKQKDMNKVFANMEGQPFSSSHAPGQEAEFSGLHTS